MGEGGFEPPKAQLTDLQSAPFGHSGTHPHDSDKRYNIIAKSKNQVFLLQISKIPV